MSFIETGDGTQLFVKDWGAGRPVVLVCGWCIGCDSWEYVMNELAPHGLRCVTYDQRGCGRSSQPWTGYDYDTLADDVAAVLEHLNLHEVTLVGHSMGCGTVARYLTRHGQERVQRAVLVATTTPFLQKTEDNPDGIARENLDAVMAAIQTDRARYVGALAPGFFGVERPDENVSQEMINWGVSLTLQASSRAAIEMLRTNFHTDQRAEMPNITVPTLLIHGDADQSTPMEITSRVTHALIPNSRLVIYQGQPHGLYITAAKRLSEDLRQFINEPSSESHGDWQV